MCIYNPGLSIPRPSANGPQAGLASSSSALDAFDAGSPQGPLTMAELGMVHNRLDTQVYRLLQSLNLDFTDVATRYFRNFHPWLPIVSPLIAVGHDHVPHSADTAVLFLAMCMVTQYPVSDDIYLSARMLFAQGQVAICASLRLVQALLLITAYEYARGWLTAAHMSIGYCARMACELGLDQCRVSQDTTTPDSWSRAEALQSWNVWWGIVVVERLAGQDGSGSA